MSATSRAVKLVLAALGRMPEPVLRAVTAKVPEVGGVRPYPEVSAALWLMNKVPGPSFETLPLERARAAVAADAALFGLRTPVAGVRDLAIETDCGRLPLRRYDPPGTACGVLVYFHGGGFTVGGLDTADSVCRYLTAGAGVITLSVDYRLAPEHPFPAAVQDGLAAYRWAVGQAPGWGLDPDAVAVGGDSSGGNLCVVTALQVRDRRREGLEDLPTPRLMLSFFPVADYTGHTRSHELFARGYFYTAAQMRWYHDSYVPDEADRRNPYASPLLAGDLRDVGPAHFGLAGSDILRDEGLALAERMREEGNDVRIDLDEGLVHSYVNATAIGRSPRRAMDRACRALREAMTPTA